MSTMSKLKGHSEIKRQSTPTGQSTFPELRRLETRFGDLALVDYKRGLYRCRERRLPGLIHEAGVGVWSTADPSEIWADPSERPLIAKSCDERGTTPRA